MAPKPVGAGGCWPKVGPPPAAKGAGWKGLGLWVGPLAAPPKAPPPNAGAGVELALAPRAGAPPAGA